MFIDVEDSVFNGILNSKKVTTVEIDIHTPSEINYLFSNGGVIKERFANAESALNKLNKILDGTNFILTNDNRLVNPIYIHTVKKDIINPNRIIFVLYGGAPVKELFDSEDAANAALEDLKVVLETMKDGGGSGEEIDLTPYLKKESAELLYAKKDEIPTQISELENDLDFTTKEYVDGLIGDIESLLGGI